MIILGRASGYRLVIPKRSGDFLGVITATEISDLFMKNENGPEKAEGRVGMCERKKVIAKV